MLGDLAEWTDPMVADVTDGLLSKVSSLEPLLHQPASPASRATAHPCTYALEPPLSEASDLPAPDPSPAPELTRRCCIMCSQDAGRGIGIKRIEHDMMLIELADGRWHVQADRHHRRQQEKHGKVIGARSST